MKMAHYLSTPAWSELTAETVLGRANKVWRERPRHILDLLDLSVGHPEHDFLVQNEKRISFGRFRNAVENGAVELARLGADTGDRVLIVLYNSPEFLLAQWAAWRVGAVPVLGNRWWSERELAEVVERVNPRLIVTDMPLANIPLVSAKSIPPDTLAGWWQLPRPASGVTVDRDAIREDDVALIVFTAGSTGVPKGVQQSHRNLAWTQQTIHIMRGGRPAAPASPAAQKVTLMTTPMFHNGGVVSGLTALLDGNRIVIPAGRFNAEEVLTLIQNERVTSWQAVPTMFNRVMRHPDFGKYDLSSLVGPSTGGTVVTKLLCDEIRRKLPHAATTFATGYGMTEMSYLTMASSAMIDQKPGTVGKPIPGVELRIDKPDTSGEGEILGRAAILMVGYFNAEEQPIDADGWYHTGDLGRVDADGFVYVTGRLKDMVIRGGENISCPQVEFALTAHQDVLEAAVVGYPDEEFGEALAAFVYARPGVTLSEQTHTTFAKGKLAYFAVPSRWIFCNQPLPVLATGKIDKRSLKKELAASLPPSHG